MASAQTGVPLNQPRLAVQLIEMVFDLALAVTLTILWRRRPARQGTVFWAYVLLYGIGRGMIEFWRGDSHRGFFFTCLSSSVSWSNRSLPRWYTCAATL